MNIVIGYFLTDFEYPFFKYTNKPSMIPYIQKWCDSVTRLGLNAIVFVDEVSNFNKPSQWSNIKFELISSKGGINQMDYRFVLLYEYLKQRQDIKAFFMTDIGDSTFLKNPFTFIEPQKIYIGDEESLVDTGWISHRVGLINNELCNRNYELIKEKKLLNCGIFGGYMKDVLPALRDISERLLYYNYKGDTVDMIVTNEILHILYPDNIVHGNPLNTEFWKWNLNCDNCYIQHK